MFANANLQEDCGICEPGKNTVANQMIEPIDGRIAGRPCHRSGVSLGSATAAEMMLSS